MNRLLSIKLIITMLMGTCGLYAQDLPKNLSLNECLKLGIENNISVKRAKLDKSKSNYKINETTSKGLPQIDGYGMLQDNLKLPVNLIPGEIFGKPGTQIPVQFGSQYTLNGGVKFTQLLYSQTYLTSIDLTKVSNDLTELNYEKSKEDLIYSLSKLYFLALVTKEQKELIDKNINRMDQLINITNKQVQGGIIQSVELDRINITKENLLSQYRSTDALLKQQSDLIKYTIDFPLDKEINLTDSTGHRILQPADTTHSKDFSAITDIRILEKQKDMALLNKKMITQGYLPSLSANGQFYYMAMRNKFDMFSGDLTNKWFGAELVGVNLSIPIFDGLEKKNKISQARIDADKAKISIEDAKKYYSIEYDDAYRNLTNSKQIVDRQRSN
ncbi:MAG: TolC family protein, partial [Bacteroidota bacterium]|nr:TolC family protein [Bacteroidota bacterium]